MLHLPLLPLRNSDDLVLGRLRRFPISPLFRVPASARTAHMYAIGLSGKGKSKLLEHCLYQDIAAGRGCGLIDPHSLLADDLLRLLITRGVLANPDIRNRLIYVDPARIDYVVPFNVLATQAEHPYDIADEVVLQAIMTRVLTPAFVEELVAAVNVYLNQDTEGLEPRIEELRHKITQVDYAIEALLDVVEQFGAAAAGPRIVAREAEKRQLEQELRVLQVRREQSHIEVSPDIVRQILAEAKEGLTSEDIQARRTVLKQFVDKVEMGNEGGTVWYTFPLEEIMPGGMTGLYLVPPRECEPKAGFDL
jgi:hypothetical protein